MPVDHIRYDILAQEALRGVVRTVLADAAKKGLPGEHHFKITFNTTAPGVRLSDRMRAQYPEVMTVVLQHQFWDLAVNDEAFEVGLSFGGIPERLSVPFDAVTAFYDPAVQFGFQFETIEAEASGDRPAAAPPAETTLASANRVRIEANKAEASKSEAGKSEASKSEILPAPGPVKPVPEGGGEIVRLDRFRKK